MKIHQRHLHGGAVRAAQRKRLAKKAGAPKLSTHTAVFGHEVAIFFEDKKSCIQLHTYTRI